MIKETLKKWIDRLAYGSLIGDLGLSLMGWVPGFEQYSTWLIKLATFPTVPLGIAYFYMSRHAIADKMRRHTSRVFDPIKFFFTFGTEGWK